MSERQPWIAGILALIYPGLGHVYLREWGRAVMWFVLALVAAVIVIPEHAFDSFEASPGVDGLLEATEIIQAETEPLGIATLGVIVGFSVIDAFVLARRSATNNADEQLKPETEKPKCPECGKPLDEDLDFCHWCTTELDKERMEREED